MRHLILHEVVAQTKHP